MSSKYPRILPSGDCALTVEFSNSISEEVNGRIRLFYENIKKDALQGINDLVPAFCSVLISYDPRVISYKTLCSRLEKYLSMTDGVISNRKKIVSIPVCYEAEYGPDLAFVAEHAGLSEEEVIKIHTSKDYLIYMLGFQPGFPYLGGLDERIFTPRLSTPRTLIRAGSVGIGGEQTGLYPLASPGGWQIIGTTPVKAYNPQKNPSIPYEAGDYIRFYPISKERFLEIEQEEAQGTYQFEIEISESV